jgi:hypothetical protein
MYKLFFIAKNNMKKQKGDMITLLILTFISAFLIFNCATTLAGMGRVMDDRFAKINGAHELLFVGNSDEEKECADKAFDENEHITQQIGGKQVILVENGRTLAITRSLFDNDSIPIEYPNSKAISLKSKKSAHYVRLEYPDSDCITVWSPTADDNAAFVCLEPWTSVPTFYDDDFEAIEDKPHAIKLSAGETYTYHYNIKLY